MNKKSLLYILLMFIININAFSQNGDIHLMTIIPDDDPNTPASANEYLFNKLSTAVSQDGVTASGKYAQFFVSSRPLVLNEDVMAGSPVRTALTLSLNLYVGDYLGEKIFSRTSFEVKGVGISRERAFMDAYSKLNKRNKKLSSFISSAKKHIINYYDAEYNNIIREAEKEAKLRNYEHAIFLLYSVPLSCRGYNLVEDRLLGIYKEYIDYNGSLLLRKAQNAWAISPDQNGAINAAEFLEKIDPNSSSYDQSILLYKEIKQKVKEDWKFEVREKYSDKVDITKQMIEGARQVGIAYGEGQQPTTTNLMWMR